MEQIKNEVLETLTRVLENHPYEVDVQVDDDLVVVEIGTAATVTTFNPRLISLTMIINADSMVETMKLEDLSEEEEKDDFPYGYPVQSLMPWLLDMLEEFTAHGIDGFISVFNELEATESGWW